MIIGHTTFHPKKIKNILNFETKFTINDAVKKDLKNAFENKLLTDPIKNSNYFNIKKMRKLI